ncbi:MAG: SDR family NAD(P)-dependent oxidoreductase [Hyphomonadaceae bacterium]
MADATKRRTALITGAANGFGWATAQRLAKAGHDVILLDKAAEVQGRAETLKTQGAAAEAITLDLADREAISRMTDTVLKQRGRIDILVNNAGMGLAGPTGAPLPLEEVTLPKWDLVVAVNLTAPFLLSQAFSPGMKANKWGRIVNISSRAGRTAVAASDPSYAATKAGIIGLTRLLALKLGPDGVTVNAIAPGRFDTALANVSSPEVMAHAMANIPVGRIGAPDEIAAAIAFLASEEAGYMTGAVLDINGGAFIG